MSVPKRLDKEIKKRILNQKSQQIHGFKVDPHVHTPFSFDFFNSYENKKLLLNKLLREAKAKEFDYINITDHNNIEAIPLAKKYAEKRNLEMKVLAGCEFSTIIGHIIAFDIEDFSYFKAHFPKNISPNKKKKKYMCDYDDAKKLIRDSGGLIIYAHPTYGKGVFSKREACYRHKDWRLMRIYEDAKRPENVDFLEIFTGYIHFFDQDKQCSIINKIFTMSKNYGEKIVCGGDAHTLSDIGNSFIVVEKNGIPDLKTLMLTYPKRIFLYNKNFFSESDN